MKRLTALSSLFFVCVGLVGVVADVDTDAASRVQSPVLPYRDVDSLVVIRGEPSWPSLADLFDFRKGVEGLASIEAIRPGGAYQLEVSEPRPFFVGRVTEGWFDQMGQPFAAGAPWARGAKGDVVVGATMARSMFGDAATALGKTLAVQRVAGPNAAPTREEIRIAGVLAADAVLPFPATIDIFVPYEPGANELLARGSRAVLIIGRLRDHTQFDATAQQVSAVARTLAETHPRNKGTSARLVSLRDELNTKP